MIFSQSDNTLVIKNSHALVKLDGEVSLGDFVAPGPGEYDVSGIGAIVLGTKIRTVVMRIEGLFVLYLDQPYELDKDDENFANIDIVAVRVRSAEELKQAEQVTKDLEPSGLLLFGPLEKATFQSELKLNTEPVDKWTVSASSLPEEGTDIVVLA